MTDKVLTQPQINALRYIVNAGGDATKETLFDDYEPIGEMLWRDLHPDFIGVYPNSRKLFVTDEGRDALKER